MGQLRPEGARLWTCKDPEQICPLLYYKVECGIDGTGGCHSIIAMSSIVNCGVDGTARVPINRMSTVLYLLLDTLLLMLKA